MATLLFQNSDVWKVEAATKMRPGEPWYCTNPYCDGKVLLQGESQRKGANHRCSDSSCVAISMLLAFFLVRKSR